MTFLTDRIRLSGPETTDPEDYLSSALGVIFPDDIMNQHGDKDSGVVYSSLFGDLDLALCDPQGDDSRKLFSHFLWNAAVQVGVFIEEVEKKRRGLEVEPRDTRGVSWGVEGERVLEVGAGTGLAGIVAALAGAAETVISDYPAAEVLKNISTNVARNVPDAKRDQVKVQGHEWGIIPSNPDYTTDKDGGFAEKNKGAFDKVIVADCLWMPWQHENLRKSVAWFLKEGSGRAWVVAGFHTGREKMKGFFDQESLRKDGLAVDTIYERNADGTEREWVEDRGREDPTARKRWLVICVLKKLDGA